MKRQNKRKTAVSATAVLTIAIFIIAFANRLFGDKLRSAFAQDTAADFDKTQDFVKIMDVGQADAALIYSNGCSAVIDAGLSSSANDIAKDLKCADIKDIDALLITHLHMDHAGALAKIAMRFPIDNLIIPKHRRGYADGERSGKTRGCRKGQSVHGNRGYEFRYRRI